LLLHGKQTNQTKQNKINTTNKTKQNKQNKPKQTKTKPFIVHPSVLCDRYSFSLGLDNNQRSDLKVVNASQWGTNWVAG